jgi:hypothetical protein
MKEKIAIGSEYNQLTGVGTEYMVIDGQVIAKFLDGNLEGKIEGSNETTINQGEKHE